MLFIGLILVCCAASIISEGVWRILSLEFAIAIVSVKIIYLMYNQARVNHFQLWVSTSIEWRLNELTKVVKKKKH